MSDFLLRCAQKSMRQTIERAIFSACTDYQYICQSRDPKEQGFLVAQSIPASFLPSLTTVADDNPQHEKFRSSVER